MAVRALCRLGGLRICAERIDLGVELMRRNMSDVTRHLARRPLAEALD